MNFVTIELLLLSIMAALYIHAIVKVYQHLKQPSRPGFGILTTSEVTDRTSPSFAERSAGIIDLGFEHIINLQSYGHPGDVVSTVAIFHNPGTRDLASVGEHSVVIQGKRVVSSRTIEYWTTFEDGREVCTNNSTLPGILAAFPEKTIERLPGVDDPAVLHALHSRVTATVNSPRKPLPAPGTDIQALQDANEEALEKQTELGYLYLDDPSGYYRPTVKGAIIMTVRLTWPVGPIRVRRSRTRARRLVRELSSAALG